MSRTIRNRKSRRYWSSVTGEVSYINNNMNNFDASVEVWYEPKPEKQYRKELAAAEKEYDDKVAANGGNNFYQKKIGKSVYTFYIYKPWVGRKIRKTRIRSEEEQLQKYNEEIEKLKKEWAKFTRDGRWSETACNQGFKHEAKKIVRRANKNFCHKVMKDLDYDDEAYPNGHEGDHSVWNWW